MPELPEVETIVRRLRVPLLGRRFVQVRITWPPMARPSADVINLRLPGQAVTAVARRGKYIVMPLSGGDTLLVHLKMTGDLRVVAPGEASHRHDRVVFDLDDGQQLRFNDPRKFGRIYLTQDPASIVGQLGPEPLDEAFDETSFAERLGRRSGRIKAVLTDQTFIAGIGNIYADEALFLAGIHPLRRAAELTEQEKRQLYRVIRQVLSAALAHEGSSLRDEAYRGGRFQELVQVYGRSGQACRVCGSPIQRVRLGQRSTHFCPVCQRDAR